MPTYKTTGIILGRHNLGEADRIIAIVTPGKGVVRVVAKGVRRIKSRLAGHLELFCESELMLARGKNLDIVTSARLLYHPAGLSLDYDYLQQAYLYAEMIQRLSGEDEHHAGVYHLLGAAYRQLGGKTQLAVVELWFKLRLLDNLGYRPDLNGCMICGNDDSGFQYYFNDDLGGLVDDRCKTQNSVPIDPRIIKLWRLILTNDVSAILKVENALRLATDSLEVCNGFYDHTFGKRFRSSEVLA